MFEGLLLPWQQIYHLAFLIQFLEQLLKFLVNFTLLKYVKSQRNYGFLITNELILGFQILDLKDHFSASLSKMLNKKHNILSNKRVKSVSFDFGVNFVQPINECTFYVKRSLNTKTQQRTKITAILCCQKCVVNISQMNHDSVM